MEKFTVLTSIAVPLLRDNIDTDMIIPSREMKSVSKSGLSDGLFAGLRYTRIGGRDPDPAFVLNDPRYAGVRILLGGRNFGSGSSREHAVWALAEYGFRAIVATSFNPIFRSNCVRNGLVPIEMDPADFVVAEAQPLTIDLEAQTITDARNHSRSFAIDAESKLMLLGGLDAIDVTALRSAEIDAFFTADRVRRPWVDLPAN